MTTYATDADVTLEYPEVANLLHAGVTVEGMRELVYSDINRHLARRLGIAVADLSLYDSTELTRCEVFGVLAELFRRNASRPGKESDWHTQQAIWYQQRYADELSAPVQVNGDLPTIGEIRLYRG